MRVNGRRTGSLSGGGADDDALSAFMSYALVGGPLRSLPAPAHESALQVARSLVKGGGVALPQPTYGTESRATLALMRRLQVLRVAGVGEFGVVLVVALAGGAQFALKLQPLFQQVRHHYGSETPSEESEQNNAAFREVIALLALGQLEDYERSVLGRDYGEMTLHTVRMVSWGNAVMAPAQVLRLASTLPSGDGKHAARLQALGVTRSWQYILSELVEGGDGPTLARYACLLLQRDGSGAALERLVRCMLAQIYAQLVLAGASNQLQHRDMQLNNVFWQVVSEPRTLYYELPYQMRLRVPLADTAPLGLLADTPVARGYLLFKIGDFGFSSVTMQVRAPGGGDATRLLQVGPTQAEGGEYDETAFYKRYDYSMVLESLRDYMRREPGFAHYQLGGGSGALGALLSALEKRRIEETVRLQLLDTDAQDMTLWDHAVSRTPWAGSYDMVHGLFARPPFDAYSREPWLDSELEADLSAIAVRYAAAPGATLAPERLQMPAMSVGFEAVDAARVRAAYRARSVGLSRQ